MAKTETTKQLEKATLRYLKKMGQYSCVEVGLRDDTNRDYFIDSIGTFEQKEYKPFQLVDVLMYCQRNNEFRCYEIKVSVADFHSKAQKSFIGNYNYYVFPKGLYEKVKDKIPKEIGVLESPDERNLYLNCIKKAQKQELQYSKERLLESLVKAKIRELLKK